jgi:hypothetical protein
VHERSVDGDFLLLLLRELLSTNLNLKIVLMSATINHEVFMQYFNGAPLLTIPGLTHPVTDMCVLYFNLILSSSYGVSRYLEDIIPITHYRPKAKTWAVKANPEEKDARVAFRRELTSGGMSEEDALATAEIISSHYIDYEVGDAFLHVMLILIVP